LEYFTLLLCFLVLEKKLLTLSSRSQNFLPVTPLGIRAFIKLYIINGSSLYNIVYGLLKCWTLTVWRLGSMILCLRVRLYSLELFVDLHTHHDHCIVRKRKQIIVDYYTYADSVWVYIYGIRYETRMCTCGKKYFY
jgi:hypothetical protein